MLPSGERETTFPPVAHKNQRHPGFFRSHQPSQRPNYQLRISADAYL